VVFRLHRGQPTLTYADVARWLQDHGVRGPTLADTRQAVLAIRQAKGMIVDGIDADARSVGSFFMNPVVTDHVRSRLEALAGSSVPARPAGADRWRVPAAWLIQRAGWSRGDGDGPVGLSRKHPLAIVNRGGARAADVVRFAARVKRRVADTFGVYLRPEPVFLGFRDSAVLEFLLKADD
jgi:UDP-N-acetylmuramate dehydrogenase